MNVIKREAYPDVSGGDVERLAVEGTALIDDLQNEGCAGESEQERQKEEQVPVQSPLDPRGLAALELRVQCHLRLRPRVDRDTYSVVL